MTLHKDGSSAVLSIALEKEGEKKPEKKKNYCITGYSNLVTHPCGIACFLSLSSTPYLLLLYLPLELSVLLVALMKESQNTCSDFQNSSFEMMDIRRHQTSNLML